MKLDLNSLAHHRRDHLHTLSDPSTVPIAKVRHTQTRTLHPVWSVLPIYDRVYVASQRERFAKSSPSHANRAGSRAHGGRRRLLRASARSIDRTVYGNWSVRCVRACFLQLNNRIALRFFVQNWFAAFIIVEKLHAYTKCMLNWHTCK